MFETLPFYEGDPILGVLDAFKRDARSHKVNLSIGIYQDAQGRVPLLDTVRRAEAALAALPEARPYQPISGPESYRRATQELVLGASCAVLAEGRVATVQTLGGGGALRVGADFLKRHFPDSGVWVSDPSWENHRVIFEAAGFTVETYPYLDRASASLRFDEMTATLAALPARSIVLLQPCCHNPTGLDLSPAQWRTLVALFAERRDLIPFMDIAYQGFGAGLDQDAAPIRALADAGVEFLVSNSFSKNMSFYGERCGALSIVCADPASAGLVTAQLELTIRANYSNPPTFGGRVVTKVLTDPILRAAWETEVATMRDRILAMRRGLHAALAARAPQPPTYLLSQCGMFSYTGLSPARVARLRDEFGVYLVSSGRMCVAALQSKDIDYVADALTAVG